MCGPPQEPRGGVAGDRKPSGEACSQPGRYFRCGLWTSGGFSCLVHDEVISLRRDLGASAPSFSSLTPPTGRGDTGYQVAESVGDDAPAGWAESETRSCLPWDALTAAACSGLQLPQCHWREEGEVDRGRMKRMEQREENSSDNAAC